MIWDIQSARQLGFSYRILQHARRNLYPFPLTIDGFICTCITQCMGLFNQKVEFYNWDIIEKG